LLRTVAAIALIVAVASIVDVSLWRDWVVFLVSHSGDAVQPLGNDFLPPAIVRIPVGIAVVIWGARTGRPWTIALGLVLTSVVMSVGALVYLAPLPRLRQTNVAPITRN